MLTRGVSGRDLGGGQLAGGHPGLQGDVGEGRGLGLHPAGPPRPLWGQIYIISYD